VPNCVAAEVAIAAGDEVLGAAVLLAGPAAPDPHAAEFLHLAAVASLTEVAVEEARHEVEQNLRGSLLEELRARPDLEAAEISRRARRLGCDLDHGAVVLCAELHTERPRHVVATVAGEYPGALAQQVDDRVYGLLPAGPERTSEETVEAARKLAARLQRHGTVALSSFYADTVAPIVHYDDQYATDLAGTLESYLEQNCNMNATAAAIYAHRHTVAYRLDRVKELTGLDPMLSEDRERLGLGLKAYRIIAPRLPR
jgi:sugar diacid utilization regulator